MFQAPYGLHIQHEWQNLLTLLKYIYLKVIQLLKVQVNFNLEKKMESLQQTCYVGLLYSRYWNEAPKIDKVVK